MVADESIPDHMPFLIDLSAVKSAPTPEQLNGLKLQVAHMRGRFSGKIAIYNPVVGHGAISQIAAILSLDIRCQAFLFESDAFTWFAE